MKDEGYDVFPNEGGDRETRGLSLRDWFAGQALSTMQYDGQCNTIGRSKEGSAKLAYEMADAMLIARKVDTANDPLHGSSKAKEWGK